MAQPLGSHVGHRLRSMLLLSIVLASFATLQDSDVEGSACTANEVVPSKGAALLQHATTRSSPVENTFPVQRHEQQQQKSMIQTNRVHHSGLPPLPADAKDLFNQKLCGVKPTAKKAQAEEKSKGDSARDTHDYDDPGPDDTVSKRSDDASADDTFPDDQDKPASKPAVAEASASRDPHLVASKPRTVAASEPIQDMDDSANNAINANDSEEQSEESSDAGESTEDDSSSSSMANLIQTKRTQSDGSESEEDSIDAAEDLWDPSKIESENVALDEQGFKKVCEQRSEASMSNFIRRVAESCNMKIIDEGGLNGVVGWFSNPDSDVSFEKLKVEMFKALLAGSSDHWVSVKNVSGITATSAPLDMLGFVQVRALRKKKETVKFVRRMVEDMGIKITDEDGFDGLMKYYSEPDDSQSFQRLVAEIKKATYEHSWCELD